MMYTSIIYLCVVSLCKAQEGPLVNTAYGTVQGLSGTLADGSPFESFKGIPYAATTEGEQRWQKPQPPIVWDGVRDATAYGPVCHQMYDTSASEDCLSLNIDVPESVADHVDNPLPVVVYIHGGAYIGGSNRQDGSEVAVVGRIIVVSINYRLGTLGFLSTGNEAAPGNYGLWDQVQALQWVNQNIAQFGGDVNRITILGLSAGSASVSHLALAPPAKGLFQRVIALSGSAAAYFGFARLQPTSTDKLASYYNCSYEDDFDVVDCLREEPAYNLTITGILVPALLQLILPTQIPVIDGDLVSKPPVEAMREGLNMDYDMLIGRTKHDGSDFVLAFAASRELARLFLLFVMNVYENRDELVELFYQEYPGIDSEDLETRERAGTAAATDFAFGCRSYLETGLHSQLSGDSRGSYYYMFNYRYFDREPEWLEGTHGEDLQFFFGNPRFDANDTLLSSYIRAYYCNFIYTGNPNEGPFEVPVYWPEFDFDSKLQLIEKLEPEVQPVSPELVEKYNFFNDVFYNMTIPVEPENIEIKMADIMEIALKVYEASEEDSLTSLFIELVKEVLNV